MKATSRISAATIDLRSLRTRRLTKVKLLSSRRAQNVCREGVLAGPGPAPHYPSVRRVLKDSSHCMRKQKSFKNTSAINFDLPFKPCIRLTIDQNQCISFSLSLSHSHTHTHSLSLSLSLSLMAKPNRMRTDVQPNDHFSQIWNWAGKRRNDFHPRNFFLQRHFWHSLFA